MPAVIRGSAKAGRGGGRGPARKAAPAYAPSKLRGAASVGFDPRAAVWIAGGGIGAVFLLALLVSGGGRMIQHGVGRTADQVGVALGFRLNTLTIKGGDATTTPAIVQAAALSQGDPILGVDLDKLRERVEGVGWVQSARVQRLLPDTIVLSVKPRQLLAVWQHGDGANVVDAGGNVIPEAQPAGFTDLPLIVGEGANEAASTILPLVSARPRLLARVDAFQRVDGRRWRLKLKDGGLIDLPAKGEDSALIQFDQLDARSHLLDLGFDRIDLRYPARTDVRPKGSTPVATGAAVGGAA